MQPALSVILLTTLIGSGQGLFLALFTAQTYALFDLLAIADPQALYTGGSLTALVLLAAGLLASFFHLGRPERAWRAAAKWRTSWLSREVIALPAFMAAVVLFGAAHYAGWRPEVAMLPSGTAVDATVMIGLAGTALAFALFVCTGMIYACLPFLREWHSPLTVVNYVLLGGASGFTLASVLAVFLAPEAARFFAAWALIITLLGWGSRAASLLRNRRLRPRSTPQTAIGVKHPVVAQKSQGFTGTSFNTREFFHGRGAGYLRAVKWGFLLGAFAVPCALLAAALAGGPALLLPLAFAVQYAGLLAERWYFFAQANHPQNLYYQCIA